MTFHKFYSNSSPFSQFYKCNFTIDYGNGISIDFSCAEQAMMYGKAILFGDEIMAEKILMESDPKKIKSLGRKVKNFDEKTWIEHREQIVKQANLAKFGQNEDLLRTMMETGDSVLVEASPYDRIWGIGLGSSDSRSDDPTQWRGKNLLGKILTEVKNELRRIESG